MKPAERITERTKINAGIVAGFSVTVVLSAMMVAKSMKGFFLGTAAWLGMMVMVMPMAGAGLSVVMAPMMTLVLHIVFGAVPSAVYQPQTKPAFA